MSKLTTNDHAAAQRCCDLCSSPATWRGTVAIKSWLGWPGWTVPHVCDDCRENACPADSDDEGTLAQSETERMS